MPLPETTQKRHAEAVQEIARLRFDFPSQEHPDFKTYVNIPQPAMAVPSREGERLRPDIVVVATPTNVLQMTAAVEVAATGMEERARGLWLPCARLPVPFYLYVPLEEVSAAKALLKKLKVRVTGLRAWRHLVGYKSLEVVNIYDRQGPLTLLLPRALIPRRLRQE